MCKIGVIHLDILLNSYSLVEFQPTVDVNWYDGTCFKDH